MFEITGDHILKLNDEDLRTLVVKLCEAELRRANLPLSAITAGGNQNAADGGVDVRVELSQGLPALDFIPKLVTGFQVKKPDMPASSIEAEMRPDDVIRPSIVDLAAGNGAYIIVSAQGSTADSALEKRKAAMRSSVSSLPVGGSLHVDFYDRDRVARWVNDYPGVALWLRERIGEPLAGWRAYGNWAYGDPVNSEYLIDDKCRIVAPQTESHNSLPVDQGIQAMRAILAVPGGIIRLIGLSGTGKTRLVQALFDSKVGNDALDGSIVVYVDQGSDQPPTPSARDMISKLAANGLRAILVVDNCNPATHRDLAQSVGSSGGSLSLITVEYDIADDDPEETHVFRLEPASEKVIEEILERLTPDISQADRHRIAEFSSGNARIALALARTVARNENLGTLKDAELFGRLFFQRKGGGDTLMRVAEVCSVFYSFDGETLEGGLAELPILAELAGITTDDLYRQIGELRSRDLVQRRSKWRAVLPHAIANRLASQALSNIHLDTLISTVSQAGRQRLLISFCRRLSYLHECEHAKEIAERWLSPGGLLSDAAQLGELGISMFKNMAPLAPGLALQCIESAAVGDKGQAFVSTEAVNRWECCKLLHLIAYETQYFDRATLLLAKFVAAEPPAYSHNSARNPFGALFHIYWSGTHALVGQRLNMVAQLLGAEEAALKGAGLKALEEMLGSGNSHFCLDIPFGARPRDFGWEPKTESEYFAWFREVVSFSQGLVVSGSPHATQAKNILARRFRELWVHAGICDELEALVEVFSAQEFWADGWHAIRDAVHFHSSDMSSALTERTRNLEAKLRPKALAHKIRAYVLSQSHGGFDLVDLEVGPDADNNAYMQAWERVHKTVEQLGAQAALAPDVLIALLPDLLRNCDDRQMKGPFGRGLASTAPDVAEAWQQLSSVLGTLHENERDISLLCGFIESVSKHDPGMANHFLDAAVTDPVIGPYFPILQSSVQIDERGARRLISCAGGGYAHSWAFRSLCVGGVAHSIPLLLLRQILIGVASLKNGYEVAVDIFGMRLHSLKTNKVEVDQATAMVGRELLMRNDFRNDNQNHAYHVNEIAMACLSGEGAYADALTIAQRLARALTDYRRGAQQYIRLAETLFRLQPLAAIKGLLQQPFHTELGIFVRSLLKLNQGRHSRRSLCYLFSFGRENPVNAAPTEVLMMWAKAWPAVRLPTLASEVQLTVRNGEHGASVWSPIALDILELATERETILQIYASRFMPGSWSGSLADVLMPYLGLTESLYGHADPVVAEWAKEQNALLHKRIENARRHDRQVDESFE